MNRHRRRIGDHQRPAPRLGLVFVIVPYLWIILTAFKRPVDAAAVPPKLVLAHLVHELGGTAVRAVPGSLVGSVIITVGTTVATLVIGVPAGYAFARGRFRGPLVPGRLAAVQPDDAAGHLHHPAVPVLPPAAAHQHVPGPDPRVHDGPAAVHGLDVRRLLPGHPHEIEEAARVDGASRMRAS